MTPDEIDRYKLWEFMSYAWTEIGIDEDEYLSLAREEGLSPATASCSGISAHPGCALSRGGRFT